MYQLGCKCVIISVSLKVIKPFSVSIIFEHLLWVTVSICILSGRIEKKLFICEMINNSRFVQKNHLMRKMMLGSLGWCLVFNRSEYDVLEWNGIFYIDFIFTFLHYHTIVYCLFKYDHPLMRIISINIYSIHCTYYQ